MTIATWNIEAMTGYTPKTTFFEDFSVADLFGGSAIKDTYRRARRDAKSMGYEALTELVMVLNWKIWQHYETCEPIARLYDTLWRELHEYAVTHLTGDALTYYYITTD